MSDQTDENDPSDLCCRHCGYRLSGLTFTADAARCPECGSLNDLQNIAADVVSRRRRRRRIHRDVAIALTIGGALVILGLLMDMPGADAVHRRLTFFGGRGAWLAIAIVAVLAILNRPLWPDLLLGDRAIFVVGAALFLLVIPLPIGAFLFVAWVIAFHAWAHGAEQ